MLAVVWIALWCGASWAHDGMPFHLNVTSSVIELNDEVFQTEVAGGRHVWIVAVVDPKNQPVPRDFIQLWEAVGTKLRGLVRVAAMDDTGAQGKDILRQLKASGANLPQVLLFPSPLFQNPQQYGAMPYAGLMQLDPLAAFAMKHIPGQLVQVVKTEEQLEKGGEHAYPKVILFNKKPTTPGLYKALTLEFLNRMSFMEVKVSKTPEMADSRGIETFPTLWVITGEGEEPIVYEGTSFKFESIVNFLLPHTRSDEQVEEMMKTARENQEKAKADRKRAKTTAAEPAKPLLNPTVRLHTDALWKEAMDKGGVTLLAILDPSSGEHLKRLATLKKLYGLSQRGGMKTRFAWIDGPQQEAISGAFGVLGEYPSVVFVNSKKGWFKNLIGSFTAERMKGFMDTQLLRGAGKPFDMEDFPPFVEESNPNGLHELPEEVPEEPKTESQDEATATKKESKKPEQQKAKGKKSKEKEKPKKKKENKDKSKEELAVEERNRERAERMRAEREAIAEQKRKEHEERVERRAREKVEKAEEAARLKKERKKQRKEEKKRKAEEEKRKAEEKKRKQEEKERKAEERKLKAALRKAQQEEKAAEKRRLAEERRALKKAEEERRRAEEEEEDEEENGDL